MEEVDPHSHIEIRKHERMALYYLALGKCQ